MSARARALVFGVMVWAAVGVSLAVAQSPSTTVVRGRVLDAKTGAPLPHTHVFIARTMTGTVTDSSGRFRLTDVQPGTKRLYVSRVGYTNDALTFRSPPGRPQIVTVRLTPKVLESPPVTVSAKRDEEWYERLHRFERLFIGPSTEAEKCALVNPEVLRFEEKWWGRFEAQAEKPLIIENRALGYRIRYFLQAFEERGSVVRWDGEPLFEPLTPRDSQQAARWQKNRLKAYRGSLRHFLRALIDNRLGEEQFELYKLPRAPAFRYPDRADRMPVRRDRILEPGPDSTYLLDAHARLEVVYRGEPESKAYLEWADITRRRPREYQTSQIEINAPPIHVEPHGEIVEPYGATLYRYFAFTVRMAHLLPQEYEPPNER